MSSQRHIRIGIDIGGTFTDLQILDERTGALHSLKTPTTPEDPSTGLMAGIEAAAARYGFALADIRLLLHGTTIATNAVLERRLARGVLLTTAGFEDVLEIGRHTRRDIYGLKQKVEPPLVPRDRRLGVAERLRGDGSVETALGEAAIGSVLERLHALEPEAIAICLLNAHVDPVHEQRLSEHVRAAFPDLPLSLSSEVSPEIREYERSSTTVLNALLMPVVGRYIGRLRQRLAERAPGARLLLVQSNGGVCSPEMAARQPVRLLLSGPSGGALATLRAAEALGRPNLVGGDMGGTSYDICVVQGGQVTLMTQGEIDGLPVRLPMIEIRTIGSGGGSLAAVDAGGRLTVGPRSAGSTPGPVCYRRGGTEPAVTDANIVLGRLDGRFFLGGAMALDTEGAREAIADRVARPLGLGAEEAAEGMLTVVNNALASAARLSLFEKGLDPRDFSLLSFGGAGGLHAIPVAEELGIGEVIFPADASTFSAFGILHSNIVHDVARSRVMPALAESLPRIAESCAALREQGDAMLEADGVPAEQRRFALSADLRYRGQAFELVVPWAALGDGATPDETALAALLAEFHRTHERRFSYCNPDAPVELVALRLTATGILPRAEAVRRPGLGADRQPEARRIFLGGCWQEAAVHQREQITGPVEGPALIEEEYTTAFIAPGWRCAPGPDGTLIARRLEA
ncbi:hydantoinase/oxoprolinase family protein (plasmid) [Roseomonas gilardii subsp. gilardii]|uniref:hydantoinase/oxoprolinase family protein n=1 Tax=Roseomonas gilardii TaxID=257708 RepID=UPI001FFAF98A|nr:hydantoinase/oxoprolinase family protein [Roseomonas gilardii]UPG74549.1 hydantoinase/oxoprolinase family protein [Roseomonas gilardii subsp. gilardii]